VQVDRINENTIRVRMNKEELEQRGLHVLDLLGDKTKIQQFFYSILDEVDSDHSFNKNAPVTFQVMPNNGGLELLISKITDKDLTGNGQAQALQPFADLAAGDQRRTQIKESTTFSGKKAYQFNDIDQVAELADNLRASDLASSLYFFKNKFYLELTFLTSEYQELKPTDAWTIANEYGLQVDLHDMEIVKATGKRLMIRDALGELRHYYDQKSV
jgi:adapter protein MecA 1/2